jgi:hypothetical protein
MAGAPGFPSDNLPIRTQRPLQFEPNVPTIRTQRPDNPNPTLRPSRDNPNPMRLPIQTQRPAPPRVAGDPDGRPESARSARSGGDIIAIRTAGYHTTSRMAIGSPGRPAVPAPDRPHLARQSRPKWSSTTPENRQNGSISGRNEAEIGRNRREIAPQIAHCDTKQLNPGCPDKTGKPPADFAQRLHLNHSSKTAQISSSCRHPLTSPVGGMVGPMESCAVRVRDPGGCRGGLATPIDRRRTSPSRSPDPGPGDSG